MLLSSVRVHLARHRRLALAVRCGLVVLVAVSAWSASSSVDRARRGWGDVASVLVAAHDLAPGDPVSSSDVRVASWPRTLVPASALTSLGDAVADADRPGTRPPAAIARQHVGRGEVLTGDDVVAGTGPDALVPAGRRGVVVPVADDLRALVHTGDTVGVVVAGAVVGTGPVVAVGGASVTVALPSDVVGRAADATLLGTAAVVLGGVP